MQLAFDLYDQGVLMVPTAGRGQYQVAYSSWREKFPGREQYLQLWAQHTNSQPEVLCGIGDIVGIDVDEKNKRGIAAIFDEELRLSLPELYPLLYVERTSSGGMHYFFKRPGTKSEDVAFSPVEQTIEEEFSGAPIKWRPIIEIKAENKLCRVHPCEGIEVVQGDIRSLPLVSDADFQHIRYIASLLNEREEEKKEIARQKSSVTVAGDSPGSDYSNNVETVEVVAMLERHGWRVVKGNAYRGRILLNRPGAKTMGTDADILDRVFCAWSSSVDKFEVGKGYSFFSLYGMLEHGGDFVAAAKELKRQGWGKSVTIEHYGERQAPAPYTAALPAQTESSGDEMWDRIQAEIDRSWTDEDVDWALTFRHQAGMSSEEFGVAAPGMIVLIGGRHKSRKSAYLSGIISARIAGEERVGHRFDREGIILWFDTEQSKKWVRLSRERMMVMSGVDRAGLEKHVLYVPLAGFGSHTDKLAAILHVIGRYEKIAAVVIDGAKDIVADVNDLRECTEATGMLRGLANKKAFILFAVMHINKNDRNMNGHMGGALEKVCDIRFDVIYDEDTDHSMVSCPFSRGERVPPFTFRALRGNIPQILGYKTPDYEYGDYFPLKAHTGSMPSANDEPPLPFSFPSTTYEQRVALIGGKTLDASDLEEMNRREAERASINLTDEEYESLYGRDSVV